MLTRTLAKSIIWMVVLWLGLGSSEARTQGSVYDSIIFSLSRHYEIDPYLVKAIIAVESDYNPSALSHKGAAGLMQLMPETARRFGVQDPLDPYENVRGGIRYLRHLSDLFDFSFPHVVAA